ncbi:hypothetical protein SAMN04487761_1228 [Lachnospiraceae bacterium C7]|nr:hypothetical protein SAMN04487761_1228 [Lachnospiraceae bacterium C7]
MQIGIEKNTRLKRISEELEIPYADALKGMMIEEILKRIYTSPYKNNLFMVNSENLSLNGYTKRNQSSLELYYIKTIPKKNEEVNPLCTMDLDQKLARKMILDIMKNNKNSSIKWTADIFYSENEVQWNLQGEYKQMEVPIMLHIHQLFENVAVQEKETYDFLFLPNEMTIDYVAYSRERLVVDKMFEMLEKLELIDTLKSYADVNKILKEDTLSGKHIMEYVYDLGEKKPRLKKLTPLYQIENYKDYTYMRRRWESYEKNHGLKHEEWNDVLKRILNFVGPIWKSYCNDEIFVADWMPGLERFLV